MLLRKGDVLLRSLAPAACSHHHPSFRRLERAARRFITYNDEMKHSLLSVPLNILEDEALSRGICTSDGGSLPYADRADYA